MAGPPVWFTSTLSSGSEGREGEHSHVNSQQGLKQQLDAYFLHYRWFDKKTDTVLKSVH